MTTDGGPAFPCEIEVTVPSPAHSGFDIVKERHPGLTKLEWFAARQMAAHTWNDPEHAIPSEVRAEWAVDDAIDLLNALEARAKENVHAP